MATSEGQGVGSAYPYLGQGQIGIRNLFRNEKKLYMILLRVSKANEVPISNHIWVASTTFKQLQYPDKIEIDLLDHISLIE